MPQGAGYGPYKPKPPAPATPPPGSSPITAPGGSPPSNATQWFAQQFGGGTPQPPAASPSPQVQAYLALQQMQQQANPQLAAAQAIPVTDASDRRDQPPTPPQAPPQAPPAGIDPNVLFGQMPGAGSVFPGATPPALPVGNSGLDLVMQGFLDRTGQRFSDAWNKPETAFYAPGGGQVIGGGEVATYGGLAGLHGAAQTGQSSVLGTKTNPDGSTDWIINSGQGAPSIQPRTRSQAPNPLQRLGRLLGVATGNLLDAAQMGSRGVETLIGAGTQAVVGGNGITGDVPLSNGQIFHSANTKGLGPTGAPLPGATLDTSGIKPLAGPGITQPKNLIVNSTRVVDVSRQLWGDTPKVNDALKAVTQMTYSPGAAQLQAVDRIVNLGQSPDVAIHGEGDYVTKTLYPLGYQDDPLKAIQADPSAKYMYAVLKAQGKTDAQIINTFNTQGLPGAEYMPTELLGQAVLDPLLIAGDAGAKVVEGMREADVASWFDRPATMEEAVTRLTQQFKPTGTALDDVLPWVKTPTAVREQTVELAHNATSLILSDAAQQAGKAGEIDNAVRHPLQSVLQAYVDSAEPAPVRALFDSDAEFQAATARWTATQANASAVLSPYKVSQSAGGRIGAALTRKLMEDETGHVTLDAMTRLLKNPDGTFKKAYDILPALMQKYQDAAEALLTPERAGAQTLAEFVAETGKPAQAFPVFERGLAGAAEKAQLADQAAKAGLTYKLNPLDTGGVILNKVKNWVNSGLWDVFAKYNPAYSFRNALNNVTTALVDGNMTVDKGADVQAFIRDVLASPLAANRGIGAGGTENAIKGGGGFLKDLLSGGAAGELKLGNVPLGAQAVEREFSQRIIYTAAKRYLDKMLVLGKAIPDLPPGVAEALGDDAVRGMVNSIQRSYGDVPAAVDWLKGQLGQQETWRILGDDDWNALNEFHGPTAQRVAELQVSAKTPDEYRAGMAAIRGDVRASLKATDAAQPPLAAMSDEVAASYASDIEKAADAGVRVDPKSFEDKLAADRLARDRAQGVAFDALKKNPTADNVQALQDVNQRLNAANATTRKLHDAARAEAWDETVKWRSMAAQGSKPKKQAGAVIDRIWSDYFAKRDKLWSDFRDLAVGEWNGLSTKLGTPYAPEAGQLALTEKAAQTLKPNIPGGGVPLNAENLVTQPRHMADPEVSRVMGEFAQQQLTDLQAGEAGYKTGMVDGYVQGTGVPNSTGESLSVPTTNSKMYRDLIDEWGKKVNKPALDKALQKIVKDNGADKGVMVERVKEYLLKLMTEGDTVNGIPPEPELLRMLGKPQEEIDAASARWAADGMEPTIKPRGQAPAVTPPDMLGAKPSTLPDTNLGAAPGGPQVQPFDQGTSFDVPLQGQPAATATGPNLTGTPFEAAATKANPIPTKWTPADPRSILPQLDSLEARTLGNWGQTRTLGMDDATSKLLDEWGTTAHQMTMQSRAIAGGVGTEARNFALLNYSDRTNLDSALSVVMPYQYWYGRTYGNWLKRAVMNPAMLANYGRYRQALDEMHGALPDYWKQQITTEDLGLPLDTPLMFNLEATLSPLYGLLGEDFSSADRRRANLFGIQGAGGVAEDLGSSGPSLWTPIIWAMAASTMHDDPQSAQAWTNNYLGGGFRAVRSASALANEVFAVNGQHPNPFGAGGVNLDPQMLISNAAAGGGFRTNTMTPWESNRVGKILTDMLATPPQGTDPKDWQAQIGEAAYLQQGPLWDKAMQQMFTETAPEVLASYFMGVGFKGRQSYEVEFNDINNELGAIRSLAPSLTKEQIAQKYIDLTKHHPDYELAALTQQSGPTRDDPWVWEAVSRVGIANNAAWLAAGVSQGALDAFFNAKTTQGMDPLLKQELLTGANALNAVVRPTSIEEQQRQLDARQTYLKAQAALTKQFPASVFDLENQYYAVRDKQGPDAAKAFLAGTDPGEVGTLYAMWDARTAALAGDPLAARYYVDPDRYRSLQVSNFYAAEDKQFPGATDLANSYQTLRDQDPSAAALLLKEHPELKQYWAAKDKFYATDLPNQVKAWAATLPTVDQLGLRQDVTPGGSLQNAVTKSSQDQAAALSIAEQSGTIPSDTGGGSSSSTTQPPTTPQQAIIDQYTAKAQAARDATAEAQTYLKTENRAAYIANTLQPLVDSLGPEVATRQLLTPFFDASTGQPAAWTASQYGVQGLLAWMGQSASVREALMAHASTEDNSNWVRYVAVLRDMPPDQLAQVARQYPQLADAAQVALAAQGHDYPSIAALDDILGVTVTIDEDGSISVGKQAVTISAKDKKLLEAGKLDPAQLALAKNGGTLAAGSAGGTLSKAQYTRLMSGSRGGGGGGGSGGAPTAQQTSDAAVGDWLSFSGQLKLTQPDMLVLLQDYFDAGDILFKERMLHDHPELYAYLQSLGDDKIAQLTQAYAAFRAAVSPTATTAQKSTASKTSINILRTYTQRPASAGLPG